MSRISVDPISWFTNGIIQVRNSFLSSFQGILLFIIDFILHSMDIKFIVSEVVILKAKILFSDILSMNSPNIQAYSPPKRKTNDPTEPVFSTIDGICISTPKMMTLLR